MDNLLKAFIRKFAGKYEYVKMLGEGGFSKVYLIKDPNDNSEYALKIMDYDRLLQILKNKKTANIRAKLNDIKKRFIREATFYKTINHPNIVKIRTVGVIEDVNIEIEIPFLITRFINGKSLKKTIEDNGPLIFEKALEISSNILSALHTIHQKGVIHRDIKPGNIIIDSKNGNAILIDFGLAKDMLSETELTVSSDFMGTPAYMSPEQSMGLKGLDIKTDIFSFGVVLHEMLTGERRSKFGVGLNTALPPGIENILNKAMEIDPLKRYKSAEEFLNSLTELEKGLQKHDKKGTEKTEVLAKPKRKGFKYLVITLAGIIIAAAAFILINPLGIGKKGINNNNQYLTHITSVRQLIQAGDFEKAGALLEKAKKIKDTPETKELSHRIARARMKKDFEALEAFLKGDAGIDEKIAKCREFLDRHNGTPGNTETKSLISRANEFIKQLEEKKQTNDQCQTSISDIGKHLRAGDYEKAHTSLEAARSACSDSGSAEIKELEDKIYAQSISDCENFVQRGNHGEAKKTLSVAKKIKPNRNLKTLEDVIAVSGKAKTVRKPGKYWTADFGDGIVMVYIPAGVFLMGEGEGRKESLPGYWMQKTEVPVKQYMKFVKETGTNHPEWLDKESPRNLETGEDKEYYKNFTGDNYPMVGISWDNAKAYCDWLSKETGLTFKLPSEAQWEKAARGTDGRLYPWGKNSLDKNLANFDNLGGKTREVGSYPGGASPYGILDMIGNVEEWCEDSNSKNESGSYPARGGNFITRNPDWLTSFYRREYKSSERRNFLGFRLCLVNK